MHKIRRKQLPSANLGQAGRWAQSQCENLELRMVVRAPLRARSCQAVRMEELDVIERSLRLYSSVKFLKWVRSHIVEIY